MPDDSRAAAPRPFPLAGADQCVKCGMCLPHCPTYRIALNEGESPRGRIALMQGLATGMLAPSPALQGHLDRCLTCRACEVVCPADVPYGTLIDAARELLAARDPSRTRLPRAMAAVLIRKPLRFAVALMLWLYQRLGLQRLVRATGLLGHGTLARLESLLPTIWLPRAPGTAARGVEPVALFTNCTSPLVEPQALDAAVTLLQQLGCDVRVPRAQTCCGAIQQHAGLPQGARACVERNLRAFAGTEPVVGIASGCTAQLVEYGLLAGSPDAKAFAARAHDVHAFIAAHPRLKQLRFAPLPARVLLHTPCTLRNVVKREGAVRALLDRIPQLAVDSLETGCCGAAGSYFLTQPAMADTLAQARVEQVASRRPAFVLSSNHGCGMHLAAALRRGGITVPVIHPLRLLAQQLSR